MKKSLSLLLALIMIFQMLPFSAFAEDGAAEEVITAAEETAAVPDTTTLAEAGLAGFGGAAPKEPGVDRQWQSAESDDIEMARYFTVIFKDREHIRSRRVIKDGTQIDGIPVEADDSSPIYGWTYRDNGHRAWFDEPMEVNRNVVITSLPANEEVLPDSASVVGLNVETEAPVGV